MQVRQASGVPTDGAGGPPVGLALPRTRPEPIHPVQTGRPRTSFRPWARRPSPRRLAEREPPERLSPTPPRGPHRRPARPGPPAHPRCHHPGGPRRRRKLCWPPSSTASRSRAAPRSTDVRVPLPSANGTLRGTEEAVREMCRSVELRGFEPLTPSLRISIPDPAWSGRLSLICAVQRPFDCPGLLSSGAACRAVRWTSPGPKTGRGSWRVGSVLGYVKERRARPGLRYTGLYLVAPEKYVSAGTFDTFEEAEAAWQEQVHALRTRHPCRPAQGPHALPRLRRHVPGGHCRPEGEHDLRLPGHDPGTNCNPAFGDLALMEITPEA